MEALGQLLAPVLIRLGIPPETASLLLIRPVSGSGALAVGSELMSAFGPDSYIGRVAAVMLGSSETTFYAVAVYFGAAGIHPHPLRHPRRPYRGPGGLCRLRLRRAAVLWGITSRGRSIPKKPRRVSAARRRQKNQIVFSGGMYVGKTLCAKRASNRPPQADDRGAERSETPLAEKASAFFAKLKRPERTLRPLILYPYTPQRFSGYSPRAVMSARAATTPGLSSR